MSQTKTAIAFDIDIKPKNSPVKEIPVKMRLEHGSEPAAPTLEEIESKLLRAEENRRKRLSVRTGTDEKVS